jgi:ferredoxin
MRVRIDRELCQGHGRCYSLAARLFAADEVGDGYVVGDGTVAPELERLARLAVANCPELAISIEEDR